MVQFFAPYGHICSALHCSMHNSYRSYGDDVTNKLLPSNVTRHSPQRALD